MRAPQLLSARLKGAEQSSERSPSLSAQVRNCCATASARKRTPTARRVWADSLGAHPPGQSTSDLEVFRGRTVKIEHDDDDHLLAKE